jgi:hypothetical protein
LRLSDLCFDLGITKISCVEPIVVPKLNFVEVFQRFQIQQEALNAFVILVRIRDKAPARSPHATSLHKALILDETLFFNLDHARSAVARWAADFNQ